MIPLQKVALRLTGDFSLQAKVSGLAGSISLQSSRNEMLFAESGFCKIAVHLSLESTAIHAA